MERQKLERTVTKTASKSQKRFFLINHNFMLLWSGQVISVIGDYVFSTTLVLWVATTITTSWSSLAVTGIFLAATLPTICFGPLAGVFTDRWESRHTILITNAFSTILTLLLLLSIRLSLFWQLGSIFAITSLLSVCSCFFMPSSYKLINDVVDTSERTRAAGLMTTLASVGIIIGPAVAAFLFFTVGVYWAILLNAFSFVVSFLTIFALHPPALSTEESAIRKQTFWQDFKEGLAFLFQNRELKAILIACILDVMYEGIFNALGVFFVVENLSTRVSGYSVLLTASGVGLILGSALATTLAGHLRAVQTFWIALLLEGTAVLIYSRLNNFIVALVAMTFIGGTVAFINVAASPIILHVTPRQFLGRVRSFLKPALTLSTVLAATIASYLDSTLLHNFHVTLLHLSFGPIDTILSITGLLAIAGGLYARTVLRDVGV